jgi:hypothetical protein
LSWGSLGLNHGSLLGSLDLKLSKVPKEFVRLDQQIRLSHLKLAISDCESGGGTC